MDRRRKRVGSLVLSPLRGGKQTGRCLCYANANLTRATQDGEWLRFVESWHDIAGSDPRRLDFDSKVVDYRELSRVNRQNISFVTILRRGPAIVRDLERQPASAGKGAVIDIPKRSHVHARDIESTVRRVRPMLLTSSYLEETPREWIIRHAGRDRVEGGPGISVNVFHLDCLANEVWLNVDLDAALTVIASGYDRWLASPLKGFEEADPKQLYRRFVERSGTVTIQPECSRPRKSAPKGSRAPGRFGGGGPVGPRVAGSCVRSFA